jgi:hypothetical protein
MIAAKINALLILPEGPYHARDSFGGKMEDPGGFQRMVEDVMSTMNAEKVVASMKVNKILISAHSGGYRPAAFVLHSGGMTDHISAVFLFDAFYALQEYFRDWLLSGHGILKAAYTEHLEQEHLAFAHEIGNKAGNRFSMTKTDVDHDNVVQTICPEWLLSLGKEWKMVPKP